MGGAAGAREGEPVGVPGGDGIASGPSDLLGGGGSGPAWKAPPCQLLGTGAGATQRTQRRLV